MNWTVFLIACIFGWIETNHFGWSWAPKSDAELIADGIVFLIIALAFVKT